MKVYIVEAGCYEDRYIAGVYSSPEAAMVAHPVPEVDPGHPRTSPASGWLVSPDGWSNGLDWDKARHISTHDVEGL